MLKKKITISSIFGSKMSYDYCGLPELLLFIASSIVYDYFS